ncbi:BIR protein [Plasmodium berghei]|uniref:BIR protein n=3 Tax=Plasmodium berghei TaxID=5821 RepID=A0A509AP98_PLABA|nr:BIR protein [Plasmodium berghei ANKA]CXI84815.1 BIR protein [Plasmodium berghei]SBW38321.1 BIR protein [Plasmodium berghei]SCL83715.1 BIR protein [Plasmodium berghei]SCL86158.1 BIR protein [Plasmodium berghei]SCL86551.1 BIR protein [Plasmodium berghei]|eukprot:XP_034423146.1 BIR protein [Plasmodium berghei ANKA]
MDDTLCQKFDLLRMHLPAKLGGTAIYNIENISNFDNYCPNRNCNTDLEKITIGFLWLLEHCYSMSKNKSHDINSINAFFLHMISWFGYQLNQKLEHSSTHINDFYDKNIKNNHKYSKFTHDAYTIGDLKDFMDKRNDFLNINIEDLSKFYDAFKLLCNIYGNVAKNQTSDILLNNANGFVKAYTELNNKYNSEGAPHSQILSALSIDYNNLKKERDNIPSLPEKKTTQDNVQSSKDNSEQISGQFSGQFSEDTSSSSSIGNKLFTVLSIFGAIAFLLGISYKYSLFGFRKRAQKQHLREKIKNIKKRMNY